jgi:aminoglycoside phosphotransferase (APT) family kinase protein
MMHADELSTDVPLVRRLLEGQFPQWTALPIERVSSSGTVNALYRLGDDLVVRLPRTDWGRGAVERELRWLPKLASLLPVEIPVPLAQGAPAGDYPWEWGIYPWLEGETPAAGEGVLARELARFVRILHGIELPGRPPDGRGAMGLERWDESTRGALGELKGTVDTDAAADIWDEALRTPGWSAPSVWTHGDLMPANLLVREGRLTGVIDWGGFGLGDPAVDLMPAWNLLDAAGRDVFRAEVDVDEEMWTRGRGWALCTGLVALPYYVETNPELAENARYRIGQVLADTVGS